MAAHKHDEPTPARILGLTALEMADRFRTGTQHAVEEHLAVGNPVYGGMGADTIYVLLPEGRQGPSLAPMPPSPVAPETRAS